MDARSGSRTTGRISVSRHACMGSGVCAAVAPRWFTPGPDGRPVVTGSPVEVDDDLADAVACCPAEALTILPLDDAGPRG